MLVELNYLKNHKAVDVGPLLLSLCEEVERAGVDPADLKVPIDWVQYKQNFREPLEPRRYLTPDGLAAAGHELAVDARRLDGAASSASLHRALVDLYDDGGGVADDDLVLEEFCRPPQSIVWSFNRAFWQHLSTWEATFSEGFVDALPGGVSDGTNPDYWRETLERFLGVLDGLDQRGLVPDEIFVLELGVGTGHQAKVWLDTFRTLCDEQGRDWYGRVRYLMSDYSHDVLRTARQTVDDHGDKVSCLNVDAVDPLHSLSFLRYKVLFVHSSNLYDNLPTEEVCRHGGELYDVEVQAYLPEGAAADVCATHGVARAELEATIQRFLRIGPEAFDDPTAGVRFWADTWRAIRLRERYRGLGDIANLRLMQSLPGLRLDDLLAGVRGDIRMHASTVALQSFVNTLPLLHPQGMLAIQDLFVRELSQYQGSFRGPGKLDGSIVNWLNGPLFQLVGERLGYTVHLDPFRHREGSRIVVLSATQKD